MEEGPERPGRGGWGRVVAAAMAWGLAGVVIMLATGWDTAPAVHGAVGGGLAAWTRRADSSRP